MRVQQQALWVVVLLVLVRLLEPAGLAAAEAELPANSSDAGVPQVHSIGDADALLLRLKTALENISADATRRAVDGRGGSLAADLEQMVLPAASLAAIEEARDRAVVARAVGDERPAADALEDLASRVRAEAARLQLVLLRWAVLGLRSEQMRYIGPLLRYVSLTEGQQVLERLVASELSAVEIRQMASGEDPVEALESGRAEQVLNRIAGEFSKERSELQMAAETWPIWDPPGPLRERAQPCKPPEPPAGENVGVSVIQAPDIDAFYPQRLQQLSIEGLVRVEIEVSEGGCVTGARTIRSSGIYELDMAAERVALEMELSPASQGGKAIATKTMLPVRFTLRE